MVRVPERLISADSHVRITADTVRERLPSKLRALYDDAIAAQQAADAAERGGEEFPGVLERFPNLNIVFVEPLKQDRVGLYTCDGCPSTGGGQTSAAAS